MDDGDPSSGSVAESFLCPAVPPQLVPLHQLVPKATYKITILRLNINFILFVLLVQTSYILSEPISILYFFMRLVDFLPLDSWVATWHLPDSALFSLLSLLGISALLHYALP